MNRRGHTGRTDANQSDIVKALHAAGCTTQTLASVGCGCPDLLVGIAGMNILIEIKDESQEPARRKLTDDQKKFKGFWKGQYGVAENASQAMDIVRGALMAGEVIEK